MQLTEIQTITSILKNNTPFFGLLREWNRYAIKIQVVGELLGRATPFIFLNLDQLRIIIMQCLITSAIDMQCLCV